MGWVDALRGSVVGLDTAPLIYFTEDNPSYLDVVEPFFNAMRRGEIQVITSMMTVLEVLVYPIRRGEVEWIRRYHDMLFKTKGLTTIEVNRGIAEEAAYLRAHYKIHTADSIHMATAIVEEASFFLTNDMRLPSLPHLKVLTLDEIKTRPEYLQ
ncbi:MAG: PIN domain-containing protein [Chloroflexi bacterium]|nr:PIN domain-containing protein [Chloroflexota bacterium]